MKVKLSNAPRGCGKLLKRVADGAASFLGQPDCLSVTAAFVGADEIKSLNAAYRNVDKVTDVLSFPSIENDGHGVIVPSEHPFETDPKTGLLDIGDIFICHDVAKAQAPAAAVELYFGDIAQPATTPGYNPNAASVVQSAYAIRPSASETTAKS